jgi:phenol 2-monooxygenase (NADPH)
MPINRSYGYEAMSPLRHLCPRLTPRTHSAIESKTHGNVLWAPLDHAATRIGYSYSSEIAAKYPDGVTEEVAVKEALESMKPFKLEFKEVHWWTVYTIGQRSARTFAAKDNRVFLCGDAAHTHSSGAAQGLNTGIHDSVNLSWKLALQLRGITQPGVLDTYCTERRSAVKTLMDYDKDISILMSHKWPSWYTGDPDADPYIILGEIFEKASSFNTGLGISYSPNVLNKITEPTTGIQLAVTAGSRPPDVELAMPGTNQKTRFQRVTRNLGKFWVVVFTGDIAHTKDSLQQLGKYLSHGNLKAHETIGWTTISPAAGCSPYETIGMRPFGNMYYDATEAAHCKFGVPMDQGLVVILRPDGLVGSAGLIQGQWIQGYFSQVLNLPKSNGANGVKAVNGF